MRKLALVILLALLVLGALSGSGASANSICVKTGLRIFGEPWVAHHFCVVCPNGNCPDLPTGNSYDLQLTPPAADVGVAHQVQPPVGL